MSRKAQRKSQVRNGRKATKCWFYQIPLVGITVNIIFISVLQCHSQTLSQIWMPNRMLQKSVLQARGLEQAVIQRRKFSFKVSFLDGVLKNLSFKIAMYGWEWGLVLGWGLPFGLGGSFGCAVRLKTRRSRVQPPLRSATFFRGDWSWNIFYGHSLPSPDSRRAVVSFWRKNVHNTG